MGLNYMYEIGNVMIFEYTHRITLKCKWGYTGLQPKWFNFYLNFQTQTGRHKCLPHSMGQEIKVKVQEAAMCHPHCD